MTIILHIINIESNLMMIVMTGFLFGMETKFNPF
mgnify:CR=1 FL=1